MMQLKTKLHWQSMIQVWNKLLQLYILARYFDTMTNGQISRQGYVKFEKGCRES